VFEHTSFQNPNLRLGVASQQRPCRASREEGFHSVRRPPVKILFGIVAVSQSRRNRNNPLMLIVGKRNENMDGSRARLLPSQEE
jgi:hypothetical protein